MAGARGGVDGAHRDEPPSLGDLGRLELACAELNFTNSLVAEATRTRDRLIQAFDDVVATRTRCAATWELCAVQARDPDAARRYREHAIDTLSHRDLALRRREKLAALDLGEPRPAP
jgi:hypothetical protein